MPDGGKGQVIQEYLSGTCENGRWGHTGLAFAPPALDLLGLGGWVQGTEPALWAPGVDVFAPCPSSGRAWLAGSRLSWHS